jgi:AraC-like DNA-binding protein
MGKVGHGRGDPRAVSPAKGAASAANARTIDLRRGSGVRAGTFVYEGPAISTRWHTHDFHQLEYATRGALGVASREAHFACPPHQAIWISAGTEHRSLLGHARTVSVFFAPELTRALPASGVRVLRAAPLLREMTLYAARWPIDRPREDTVAETYFATMAALLPEWLDSDGPWSLPVSANPVVSAAMEYTLAHLTDATPRAVARHCAVSERSLRRLFAGEAGISWSTYLVRARLLRAMTLLATTNHGVLRIAGEVGYDSATSLSRALRAWTGCTPSEYRAQTHAADGG